MRDAGRLSALASELLCNTTRLYSQIPYIRGINHDFSRCALLHSQPSNSSSLYNFPLLAPDSRVASTPRTARDTRRAVYTVTPRDAEVQANE